jgi:molecular chaperone GrpE
MTEKYKEQNNKQQKNEEKKEANEKREKLLQEVEAQEKETLTAEVEQTKKELKQMEKDLEKARLEASEYLDVLKRLKAEFDNFRKRMLKEQSEFLKLAATQIILQLLPVVDNFERALAHKVQPDKLDEYMSGWQLVYSQLLDVLHKEGLKEIEAVNVAFDPLKHEAMLQVATDAVPEGHIVEVLEKGYELKGRVIRPAKVKVAVSKEKSGEQAGA